MASGNQRISIQGTAEWREGGALDPACWVCTASMLFYEDCLPIWGGSGKLVIEERDKAASPRKAFIYQIPGPDPLKLKVPIS